MSTNKREKKQKKKSLNKMFKTLSKREQKCLGVFIKTSENKQFKEEEKNESKIGLDEYFCQM